MTNHSFEQAKQAVAERYGLPDWATVIYEDCARTTDLEKMYEEAAELYAQWRANEAVKAALIAPPNVQESAKSCELVESIYDVAVFTSGATWMLTELRNRPIPFPPTRLEMKTFQKHLQEIYGTEDEMHYIAPRLSDNDLLQAVHSYTREAIKEHLSRVAENAKASVVDKDYTVELNYYPVHAVDRESITNIEIILP